MKVIGLAFVALILMAVEGALSRVLGLEFSRIEFDVAFIVAFALRCPLLIGAVGAFLIGFFSDVLGGLPTWLYPAVSGILFITTRLVARVFAAQTRWTFVLLVGGASVLKEILAMSITWVASAYLLFPAGRFGGITVKAVSSAVVAYFLWPAVVRLWPSSQETHPEGLL